MLDILNHEAAISLLTAAVWITTLAGTQIHYKLVAVGMVSAMLAPRRI